MTRAAFQSEASARPAGAKRPPPAGRALAGGFGPPSVVRIGRNVAKAMALANGAIGLGLEPTPSPLALHAHSR